MAGPLTPEQIATLEDLAGILERWQPAKATNRATCIRAALARIEELESTIRKYRDGRGDDEKQWEPGETTLAQLQAELERLRQPRPVFSFPGYDLVQFLYRNHRGEVAMRTVNLHRFYYGTTDFYPEPGWIMEGWDQDKEVVRTFSLRNILTLP